MDTKNNYGDLPDDNSSYPTASIVVLPVPYDGTSTWIKGADDGPRAIIEASAQVELYDIETGTEVYLRGIFTDDPVEEKTSPERMAGAVAHRAAQHLENGKFLVTLGGEHSVTIGVLQAFGKQSDNFTVLQLDAHADLRMEYHGSACNHACVMARAKEKHPIVQVGIRSMDGDERHNAVPGRIFYAHEMQAGRGWIDEVVALLTDRVYVTIDLDVFDISIMPATGTPEPGGLSWYDVLALLKKVAERKTVIGFDVVELCPNEFSGPSNFLAAKLIYKFLSYIFSKGDVQ